MEYISFQFSVIFLWFSVDITMYTLRMKNPITQQMGVHETPLCVLLELEILCSSTKLTFVLLLSACGVFHVFGFALSLYHMSSHWVRVCLRSYRAHGELKMVSNQHIVNTENFGRRQLKYIRFHIFCIIVTFHCDLMLINFNHILQG